MKNPVALMNYNSHVKTIIVCCFYKIFKSFLVLFILLGVKKQHLHFIISQIWELYYYAIFHMLQALCK